MYGVGKVKTWGGAPESIEKCRFRFFRGRPRRELLHRQFSKALPIQFTRMLWFRYVVFYLGSEE